MSKMFLPRRKKAGNTFSSPYPFRSQIPDSAFQKCRLPRIDSDIPDQFIGLLRGPSVKRPAGVLLHEVGVHP